MTARWWEPQPPKAKRGDATRRRIAEYILEVRACTGITPSDREIARAIGVAPHTVGYHLRRYA